MNKINKQLLKKLEAQPGYDLSPTHPFKSDYKRISRDGRHNIDELKYVVELIRHGKSLPASYQDHWINMYQCRELHIEGDWLLFYLVSNGVVHLLRTRNHNNSY